MALLPIIAIAIFDVWQSRYAYNEGMKMTKSEVKDEQKQTDGDPVIKGQQRRKMMEMMSKRMLADVPKADVVVTNPTHIAVALSYNTSEAPAPSCLPRAQTIWPKNQGSSPRKPDSHSRKRASGTGFV